MKYSIGITILVLIGLSAQYSLADLKVGQTAETLVLKDELGGYLDGSPWSSEALKGKVSVLFYVDPDKKDLNNETSEALKKEGFPPGEFQSFAVVNMAATWLPNFAISSSLKESQKKYKNTIYVRDYKKVLVGQWGISDDNNNVLAFDKNGKLIFRKDGRLNEQEIEKLIKTIREHF